MTVYVYAHLHAIYMYEGCLIFWNHIYKCVSIFFQETSQKEMTKPKFLAFLMSSFHTEDHHVCQTTM